MRAILIALSGLFILSACATVATFTIENRLKELGLSDRHAECMTDELEDRLSDDELTEFARFTINLTRRDDPVAVLDALRAIKNERIAREVGTAGLICIIRG